MKPAQRQNVLDLPPEVQGVIATILHPGGQCSDQFFRHPRLGVVYRAYVICQVLDSPHEADSLAPGVPPSTAARILASFNLTGQGSENWLHLYEHIGGVVAAALTIGKRMGLGANDLAKVRSAALLHDSTKREDVKRHGTLANSLWRTGYRLAKAMRKAGYPQDTIIAAMNTGREGRKFDSDESRRRSIKDKGVVAAIVGLADTLTIGAEFRSLPGALEDYLSRKRDRESQEFFTKYWEPYYRAVESYLTEKSEDLELDMTNEDIYNETVFPEVFGPNPPSAVIDHYSYFSGKRIKAFDS